MSPQQTIAHYRITSKLGEGGMGEVWRATDTKLNRDVAIKILPQAFAQDPDRMARFTREAQVLASLNHPNIAAIYGVEDRALIMELVEGPTLAERIEQGPIPVEDALPILQQLVDALEYAHEKNIIHRDLKPANVKVTPEGKVKVLDFGLAKALTPEMAAGNPASSPTLTMRSTVVGTLLGTAAYMAPEQARGQNVDKRADIWAFGVVMYEMLTGRQLFGGPTISDTLAAVLKTKPDLSAVPAPLRLVVEKSLRKDPRVRWRDIGDVRIALDEDASEAAPVDHLARGLRHRIVAWSLAAIFATAAATLSVIHFREKPPVAQAIRFTIPPPEKGTFGNWISVSPDGRKIAFTAVSPEGTPRIWVRAIDSLDARPLATTEGQTVFFWWSPDSRFLVFQTGGKLKRIDVSGGPPQTLCDVPNVVLGGSWNRDGTIIFGTNSAGVARVSSSGGAPSPLTILDPSREEVNHSDPFFLPDGRHFLYLRRSALSEKSGVYLGSLDSKPEQQSLKQIVATGFSPGYAPPEIGSEAGHLLYLRDGTLMAQQFNASRLELEGEPKFVAEQVGVNRSRAYFSVSANGVLAYRTGGNNDRMAWFSREGKLLGPAGAPGPLDVALSRDGTRVAYSRGAAGSSGSIDVWTFDLLHGVETRVSSNADGGRSPVWSPDGTQIFFYPSVGSRKLYRKAASGAGSEELLWTGSGGVGVSNDWSSDGRFLMYSRFSSKGKFELWVLPVQAGAGGERKPSPFLQTDFNNTQGQFSPDSHFVAYTSDESGSPEIYVRPFPAPADSSLRWKISSGGGSQPRWRRDGKELFYVSAEGLKAVEVTLAPVFKAGAPQALFTSAYQNSTQTFRYDAAPDGKRFLMMTTLSTGNAPITVVVNWTAGLNK